MRHKPNRLSERRISCRHSAETQLSILGCQSFDAPALVRLTAKAETCPCPTVPLKITCSTFGAPLHCLSRTRKPVFIVSGRCSAARETAQKIIARLTELISSKGLGKRLRLFVDLIMLRHLVHIHFAFGTNCFWYEVIKFTLLLVPTKILIASFGIWYWYEVIKFVLLLVPIAFGTR